MCNACSFSCCASDDFEGCGCECREDRCAEVCALCQQWEEDCICGLEEDEW